MSLCDSCDCIDETVLQRVQDKHRLLTMAVTSSEPVASSTWHDDDAILEECKWESLTTRLSDSSIAMVRSNKHLIADCINGTIDVEEERIGAPPKHER